MLGFNKEKNEVIVGFEEECERSGLIASDLCGEVVNLFAPLECEAKIRSSQQPMPAKVTPLADGKIEVRFYAKQKAIAPGQSVVFYHKDAENDEVLLGGGIIDSNM